MARLYLLPFCAAAAAAAATTTVDMIVPGWDARSMSASVVDVDAGLTTYQLQCNHPASCPQPATIVQGRDVWSLHSLFKDKTQTFTYDYDCHVDRPQMTCTISMDGHYPGGHTTRSTVDTTNDISQIISPIAVTAGVAKLTHASAGPTTAPSDATTTAEATRTAVPGGGSSTDSDAPARTTTTGSGSESETRRPSRTASSSASSVASTGAARESAVEPETTAESAKETSSWSATSSTSASAATATEDEDSAAGSLVSRAGAVVAIAAVVALL